MKTALFGAALLAGGLLAHGAGEVKLNLSAVTGADGKPVVLGTEGSYNNNASSAKQAVFDGNLSTFFDPASADAQAGNCWAGIEMQTPKVCVKVEYKGRSGLPQRMSGCRIEGANTPDFSDAQVLHVIAPPNTWNGSTMISEWCNRSAASQPYKYFRILGPNPYLGGGWDAGTVCGNVSELVFWGFDAADLADVTAPAAPAFTFADQLNGIMNIRMAGGETVSGFEIQRKAQNETEWKVWQQRYVNSSSAVLFRGEGNGNFTTDYRVCAWVPGARSAWSEIPTVAPTYPLKGAWVGPTGSWQNNPACTGAAAFDGNVSTYVDAPSGKGTGHWTGLDFGAVRTVRGIRYIPRSGLASRMNGGTFEIANNSDFSDAHVFYTIPSTPANGVTEVILDEPVSGRYARYVSPETVSDGGCNVTEIEFMGERTLTAPSGLAITRSDLANFLPVLKWTPNANDGMSSTIVWKAIGPGGPWSVAATLPATESTWTNESARVGQKIWYRLGSVAGADETLFIGEPSGERVPFRRGERIERDPANNTQLRAGFKSFEYFSSWKNGADKAIRLFDGSTSTYADIVGPDGGSDLGDLMAGIDFGEPCGFICARGYPRSGQMTRATGHCVFGSNDTAADKSTWARTKLSGNFSFGGNEWKTVEGLSVDDTFTKMFISKPTGNGFCNFSEIEIYGWRESAVADVLQGPEGLAGVGRADGQLVTWRGCAAATEYRVERTVNDSGTWTLVATVAEPRYLDADVQYDGHVYCYRVTAVKGDETAVSDVLRTIPYIAANGTGLLGTYSWPWKRDNYEAVQATQTRVDSTIDFDWTTGKLIDSTAGATNYVHVSWRGTLVVPFDGEYKFTTTVDDYVTLRIGTNYLINAWGVYAANTNVTIALTAGEHPIRVDYAENTGSAKCTIKWGGCVVEGVIPSAQLIPAETADESPWEGNRTFGSPNTGAAEFDGDVIRIGAAGGDVNGTERRYHYLWRTVAGNFDMRCHVKAIDKQIHSKVMLMARASLDVKAPFVAPALTWDTESNGGEYAYGAKRCMAQGEASLDATPAWTAGIGGEGDLRLVRVGDTFTCYARPGGATRWETIAKYTFDAGTFGDEVKVGLAAARLQNRVKPYFHEVTGFEVGRYNAATVIMLR